MKIDRFCKCLLRLSIFAVQIWPGSDGAGAQSENSRRYGHVAEILLRRSDRQETLPLDDPRSEKILQDLQMMYERKILPLELATKFSDLKINSITGDEIRSKPVVLLVGPWSTGKTTFLNYLLDISDEIDHLETGVNPTTNDFVVVSHGPKLRVFDGRMLTSQEQQQNFDQFGSKFLEHLYKIEMPKALLQNLTFVDTPGFMEHRKLPERGYPFKDVIKWWARRADLILVIFDPTKLDVGSEMDALFTCLKGKESMVRIILNKADSVNERELMRVYGSLLWSLAPLFNVTEPPRVYVASLWPRKPYSSDELGKMLLQEEEALLTDLRQTITKQLFTKISRMEMQASLVVEHSKILLGGKKTDRSIYKKFFAENSMADLKINDLKIAQKVAQEAIIEDLPLFKQKLSKIITLDEDDLDLEPSKTVKEESTKKDDSEEASFSDLFEHNLGRGYEHAEEIPDQVRKMIKKNKRVANKKKQKSAKSSEEEDVQQEKVQVSENMKNDPAKEQKSATSKCKLYRKTCIEVESTATKSDQREVANKKCLIYRKSCQVPKIKVAAELVEQEKPVVHKSKVEPAIQNPKPKCPPYRKKCETPSQEHIIETISPKTEKCPPYRKSCDVEIAKLEKVEPEKRTVVVETTKSKCPPYRKERELDKVEDLPIEIPKPSKCSKYRKSCTDDDVSDKSTVHDTYFDEKSKKQKSGEKPMKLTLEEPSRKSKSKEKSNRPKSEEKLEKQKSIKPKLEEKSKESTSEEDYPSRRRVLDSGEDSDEGVFVEDVEDKEHIKKRKKDSPKDKKKSTRLLTEESKEEQKERKCPPYRKSCDPATVLQTTETFTSWMKLLSKLILGKSQTKARKCILYRKSCSEDQKREGEKISMPKGEQKTNKKTAEPDEIKRQKESIAPSDRSEETILEKTYPTESEKCLNYRKSCQEPKLRTNEQSNVEKTTEKLLQYTKERQPAQKKCPIYRKSCESFPKIATFDGSSSKADIAAKEQKEGDQATPEGKMMGKCPIYRKSCAKYEKHSDHQSGKSQSEGRGEDDENFIYVLDKKTGKTTKYCKKKSTKSKK